MVLVKNKDQLRLINNQPAATHQSRRLTRKLERRKTGEVQFQAQIQKGIDSGGLVVTTQEKVEQLDFERCSFVDLICICNTHSATNTIRPVINSASPIPGKNTRLTPMAPNPCLTTRCSSRSSSASESTPSAWQQTCPQLTGMWAWIKFLPLSDLSFGLMTQNS